MKVCPSAWETAVFVCMGDACRKRRSKKLLSKLGRRLREDGLARQIHLNRTGCLDRCSDAPVVLILPERALVMKVNPSDAQEIVDAAIRGRNPGMLTVPE